MLENIYFKSSCMLPTKWGLFTLYVFYDNIIKKEHLVMFIGDIKKNKSPILSRIHSECLTGDTLFSQKCDCGLQLEYSFKKISLKKRGIILYLRQEGRGIGLINKIKAYNLQDKGYDTITANLKLGFPIDNRKYDSVLIILKYLGIKKLKLMTNNPEKINFLRLNNIYVKRIPLIVNYNIHNIKYMKIKFNKLKHLL